jgi:hypothetical protein
VPDLYTRLEIMKHHGSVEVVDSKSQDGQVNRLSDQYSQHHQNVAEFDSCLNPKSLGTVLNLLLLGYKALRNSNL